MCGCKCGDLTLVGGCGSQEGGGKHCLQSSAGGRLLFSVKI
ncbi:hypothetical protein [Bartonella tribocorum]|nr:hypothetical protein [Bartonella tribocorum]